MNKQMEALAADLGPLQEEVSRLCATHDGRLVMAALVSSAVAIGRVLSAHGKSQFVSEVFEGALAEAPTPAPAQESKVVYVDGNERLGSKQ